MAVVLVHGVPDTTALWDPLVDVLDRDDIVRLALPGFGVPVPDGFACTKEAYADWVVEQLEAIGEPVDLVGHDWGSLLVQRVVLTRPDLVRTFVMADAAITEAFEWHDLAVAWQTPEVGEQMMEAMVGEALEEAFRGGGHPAAGEAAGQVDETMKRSILALYRSATDIAQEWSPTGPIARPRLVVWGRNDPFGPPASGERFAAAAQVPIEILDAGHWAPVERPRETAALLSTLWANA